MPLFRLCCAVVAAMSLLAGPSTALGQETTLLNQAMAAALDDFEQALPRLAGVEMGVEIAAYRDALSLQQFSSDKWGGTVRVVIEARSEASGSCSRFAAFARVPPDNGVVPLVLCPKFFTQGADELRKLTILHEMVHVVAGTDECQAMAFAAEVQRAATGRFTPVDGYWQASGCEGSGFRLPD